MNEEDRRPASAPSALRRLPDSEPAPKGCGTNDPVSSINYVQVHIFFAPTDHRRMKGLLERFWDWRRQRRIQQITLANARERVQRGAAYLDEHDPGWHQRVDAESLELSDGAHCVLGQLHGDFRLGLGRSQMINLSSAPRASLSPIAYGFKCVSDVPDTWQDRDYRMLNAAWTEEVTRRQMADNPCGDGHAGDDLPTLSVHASAPVPAADLPTDLLTDDVSALGRSTDVPDDAPLVTT